MFQDGSEGPPTYSRLTDGPRQQRSLAIRARHVSNPPSREPGTKGSPRPEPRQTSPSPSVSSQRHVAPRRGRRSAAADRADPPGRVLADPEPKGPPRRRPESPSRTSRAPPFTATQFHVLLNSLFKVLFNFPSRYLFAIGLGVIFSLTWSLPRALSCTPKQLDSGEKPARQTNRPTGLSPSSGHGPSQDGLGRIRRQRGGSPEHHIPRDPSEPAVRCWALPVSFAITKGITVVFFSSAY